MLLGRALIFYNFFFLFFFLSLLSLFLLFFFSSFASSSSSSSFFSSLYSSFFLSPFGSSLSSSSTCLPYTTVSIHRLHLPPVVSCPLFRRPHIPCPSVVRVSSVFRPLFGHRLFLATVHRSVRLLSGHWFLLAATASVDVVRPIRPLLPGCCTVDATIRLVVLSPLLQSFSVVFVIVRSI